MSPTSSPAEPAEGAVPWAAHDLEVRRHTRETGLLGGAILLAAMPVWALFDAVQVPDQASAFLGVRIGTEVLAALVLGLLAHPRFGLRRAEPLVLLLLALPVAAIAYMVAEVPQSSLEPYLLGYTLPIYASAFLLVWRWEFTVSFTALAAGALALALLVFGGSRTDAELVTITLYVSTASAVAVLGQLYRHRLSRREFAARAALEQEQVRSRELLSELRRLSREDSLTGLANRRCWDEAVERHAAIANRSGSAVAVLLCDLDHFKDVNDADGHARGDAVLRAMADSIASRVRSTDLVARLGGDEVGVLCPDTGLDDAARLAVELQGAVRSDVGGGLTMSVGVAASEDGSEGPGELVDRADEELYRAKLTRDAVWGGGRRWDPAPSSAAGVA